MQKKQATIAGSSSNSLYDSAAEVEPVWKPGARHAGLQIFPHALHLQRGKLRRVNNLLPFLVYTSLPSFMPEMILFMIVKHQKSQLSTPDPRATKPQPKLPPNLLLKAAIALPVWPSTNNDCYHNDAHSHNSAQNCH